MRVRAKFPALKIGIKPQSAVQLLGAKKYVSIPLKFDVDAG